MKLKFISKILSIFLFYFILSLSYGSYAFSKDKYTPQFQYPFSEPWRWHAIPELEGRGFQCMTEDNLGAIWFGVNKGIMKYDGLSWTSYLSTENEIGSPVTSLCSSPNGTIYAGSRQGLSRFQNGRWEMLLALDESSDAWDVVDIKSSKNGEIWASIKSGLLYIKNDQMVLITGENQVNRIRKQSANLEVFILPEKVSSSNSLSQIFQNICITKNSELCFVLDDSNTRSIIKFSFKNDRFQDENSWEILNDIPLKPDEYTQIYQTRNGDLWFTSINRIVHYKLKYDRYKVYQLGTITQIPYNNFICETDDQNWKNHKDGITRAYRIGEYLEGRIYDNEDMLDYISEEFVHEYKGSKSTPTRCRSSSLPKRGLKDNQSHE